MIHWMMTPIEPVIVPGVRDDVVGRDGRVVAAGRRDGLHRDDDGPVRLLAEARDLAVELLRGRDAAAGRVDPHDDGLDVRGVVEALERLAEAVRGEDHALEVDDADAAAEREAEPVRAGRARATRRRSRGTAAATSSTRNAQPMPAIPHATVERFIGRTPCVSRRPRYSVGSVPAGTWSSMAVPRPRGTPPPSGSPAGWSTSREERPMRCSAGSMRRMRTRTGSPSW